MSAVLRTIFANSVGLMLKYGVNGTLWFIRESIGWFVADLKSLSARAYTLSR